MQLLQTNSILVSPTAQKISLRIPNFRTIQIWHKGTFKSELPSFEENRKEAHCETDISAFQKFDILPQITEYLHTNITMEKDAEHTITQKMKNNPQVTEIPEKNNSEQ